MKDGRLVGEDEWPRVTVGSIQDAVERLQSGERSWAATPTACGLSAGTCPYLVMLREDVSRMLRLPVQWGAVVKAAEETAQRAAAGGGGRGGRGGGAGAGAGESEAAPPR